MAGARVPGAAGQGPSRRQSPAAGGEWESCAPGVPSCRGPGILGRLVPLRHIMEQSSPVPDAGPLRELLDLLHHGVLGVCHCYRDGKAPLPGKHDVFLS